MYFLGGKKDWLQGMEGQREKNEKNEKLISDQLCLTAIVQAGLYKTADENRHFFQDRMNRVCLWHQILQVTCPETARHEFPFGNYVVTKHGAEKLC